MSLKEQLLKNSTIKLTALLEDSTIFKNSDAIRTKVPMINVALSGSVDGGLRPGLLMLAGPSKHFKTGFALLMVQAFLEKHPNGIVLFYDSEFGTPLSYFNAFGVNKDQIIHTPIKNVEEFKFDIIAQLEFIEAQRKEKGSKAEPVLVIVDSIGNLASKKELEDAKEQKSVTDMSRAKSIKSLFRMVTPYLTLNHIPMVVVNHTYKEIGMFPKDIVGGGTGSYYSSNDIWILGRQQDKDGKELSGYNFVIKIEKSRSVQEGKRILINLDFDAGINRWSGLLELALAGGYIVKPKVGWYALVNRETGEEEEKKYREADLVDNKDIWGPMLRDTDFATYIENEYKLNTGENILDIEA